MTFNIKRLKKVSFKGAKFFLDTASLDGGIKFAEIDYPSSRREGEFIGIKKYDFRVQGFTDDTKNFKTSEKLMKKLNNSSPGIFKHPILGGFYCYAVSFARQDNITTELGKTYFTIDFKEVDKDDPLLKKAKGFLAKLKSDILGKYEDVFDKAFESVKNAKEQFDSASETLQNATDTINQVANTIATAGESFGDFVTSISQFKASINNLIQSPKLLARNLKISFQNLEVAFSSKKDVFNVCKNLFTIDAKDSVVVGNSAKSNAIRNNQNEINKMVKVYAIATALSNCVNISFENTEELNQVINDISIDLSAYDQEIKANLTQMRAEAITLLYEQAVSLPNINYYQVDKPTSINILVYSIYGSVDKKETIRKINNIKDSKKVSGTIKILTSNA